MTCNTTMAQRVLCDPDLFRYIVSFQSGTAFKHINTLVDVCKYWNLALLCSKVPYLVRSYNDMFAYGTLLTKYIDTRKDINELFKLLNVLYHDLNLKFNAGSTFGTDDPDDTGDRIYNHHILNNICRTYNIHVAYWFDHRAFPFHIYSNSDIYINDMIINCPTCTLRNTDINPSSMIFYFIEELNYKSFTPKIITSCAISGNLELMSYIWNNYKHLFNLKIIREALTITLNFDNVPMANFLKSKQLELDR